MFVSRPLCRGTVAPQLGDQVGHVCRRTTNVKACEPRIDSSDLRTRCPLRPSPGGLLPTLRVSYSVPPPAAPPPTPAGEPSRMRLTLPALISHGRVARRIGLGPQSRINMLRNILTGLVRHERIETTAARADEVRFYAEKVRRPAEAS